MVQMAAIMDLGIKANFNYPNDLAIDSNNNIYISDSSNGSIRKIDSNRNVSNFGKYSNGQDAFFQWPRGITVDQDNVYFAEFDGHRIIKIDTNELVETYAGNGNEGFIDGSSNSSEFAFPTDVAFDSKGNLYVADHGNNAIRKISASGNVVTINTIFENNIQPFGLTFDSEDNLYVTHRYEGHRILKFLKKDN